MEIKFLFAPDGVDKVDLAISHFKNSSVWHPFDDRAISFVNQFSLRLLKIPKIHQYPDLVALAYWFRRSNIKKLSQTYKHTNDFVRIGRGLSFHVAPGNVDTIFVYSFFISLLSGNLSFIRVSQNKSPQLNIILTVFNDIYKSGGEESASRFLICTYPHDNDISTLVSKHCDVRLIWGGDETVNKIASIPIKPTANELKFPNRTSFSAINLNALKSLNNDEFKKLAESFYNDIQLFGQQACSSPIAIYFVGLTSNNTQIERFWKFFIAATQHHNIEPSGVMDRFVSASSMAVSGAVTSSMSSFVSSSVVVLNGDLSSEIKFRVGHSGEGLLLQYVLPSLKELASHIIAQDQTLSIFGFTRDDICLFTKHLSNRGIDRIVPIGKALDFGHIWDGHDLFESMSRKIDVSKI